MENLIAQLKTVMERCGYTQTYVAKTIDRSSATVNQFLQNKYKGDEADISSRIKEFIATENDRLEARFQKPPFVETMTSRDVNRLIDYAKKYCAICVLTADSGMGKSAMLENYASSHPGTVLVEVCAGYTPRAFINTLLRAVDPGAGRNGTTVELMGKCIDKLRGSRRLVLVDEAELLPHQTLEALRRLYDMTNIGVVLVGMPRLSDNLIGAEGEHAQLYSRIARRMEITNPLPREDFDLIAAQMMPESVDKKISELLFYYSSGNARQLLNIVRGVYDLCDMNQQPVNIGMIQKYTGALLKAGSQGRGRR